MASVVAVAAACSARHTPRLFLAALPRSSARLHRGFHRGFQRRRCMGSDRPPSRGRTGVTCRSSILAVGKRRAVSSQQTHTRADGRCVLIGSCMAKCMPVPPCSASQRCMPPSNFCVAAVDRGLKLAPRCVVPGAPRQWLPLASITPHPQSHYQHSYIRNSGHHNLTSQPPLQQGCAPRRAAHAAVSCRPQPSGAVWLAMGDVSIEVPQFCRRIKKLYDAWQVCRAAHSRAGWRTTWP